MSFTCSLKACGTIQYSVYICLNLWFAIKSLDTGRKDTDQLQDSEKGRREMEWESTKEAPAIMSNLFIFTFTLMASHYIVLCIFLYI